MIPGYDFKEDLSNYTFFVVASNLRHQRRCYIRWLPIMAGWRHFLYILVFYRQINQLQRHGTLADVKHTASSRGAGLKVLACSGQQTSPSRKFVYPAITSTYRNRREETLKIRAIYKPWDYLTFTNPYLYCEHGSFFSASGLDNIKPAPSRTTYWNPFQRELMKLPLEHRDSVTQIVITGDDSIVHSTDN